VRGKKALKKAHRKKNAMGIEKSLLELEQREKKQRKGGLARVNFTLLAQERAKKSSRAGKKEQLAHAAFERTFLSKQGEREGETEGEGINDQNYMGTIAPEVYQKAVGSENYMSNLKSHERSDQIIQNATEQGEFVRRSSTVKRVWEGQMEEDLGDVADVSAVAGEARWDGGTRNKVSNYAIDRRAGVDHSPHSNINSSSSSSGGELEERSHNIAELLTRHDVPMASPATTAVARTLAGRFDGQNRFDDAANLNAFDNFDQNEDISVRKQHTQGDAVNFR